MLKNLKNKKSRRIALGIVAGVLVIALLIAFILPSGTDGARAQESVHSATAEVGTLATTVTATGNLETVNAETIRIPTGLTVDDIFVSAGDIVSQGDALARFDLGSVQTRLAEVQEEIADLDREIERSRNDTEPTRITAGVSGRVKAIFAETGDLVANTVITYEALVLLSLDGRMAVDIETTALNTGDTVTVILPDGTEHTGDVVNTMPHATITLTDNGPRYGDAVTITQDGTELGRGTLRINQPLAVTGTSGAISRIHVTENASVRAGATLFTLEDVDTAPAHLALIAERTEQAEVLRTLLSLMQTGVLTAGFDGIVEQAFIGDNTGGNPQTPSMPGGLPAGIPPGMFTGVSHTETSNGSADLGIVRLSDATPTPPVGRDDLGAPQYPSAPSDPPTPPVNPSPPPQPEFQMIDSLSTLNLAPPVLGMTPQSTVQGTNFSGAVQWIPAAQVFMPATEYRAALILTAAEGFLFSQAVLDELEAGIFPTPGATVIGVEMAGNNLAIALSFPATAGMPGGDLPGMPQLPSFPSMPGFGGFSMPSMPGMGMDASGMMGQGALSSDIQTPAFTIAAGDTMQIRVSVDERDILSLAVGQSAAITLEAVEGETFQGEITRINAAGTAGGGGARYQVEITMPRTEHMLPGMSASAIITTDEVSDILLIPAEAIQEDWPRVYVYTNVQGSTPIDPVDVETGLSDGLYVEVRAGLNPGDTVYFIQVETQRWPMWGMGPMGGGPGGGGN